MNVLSYEVARRKPPSSSTWPDFKFAPSSLSAGPAKLSVKAIVEPTRLGRQFVGLPDLSTTTTDTAAPRRGDLALDLQSGELTGLDYKRRRTASPSS